MVLIAILSGRRAGPAPSRTPGPTATRKDGPVPGKEWHDHRLGTCMLDHSPAKVAFPTSTRYK